MNGWISPASVEHLCPVGAERESGSELLPAFDGEKVPSEPDGGRRLTDAQRCKSVA